MDTDSTVTSIDENTENFCDNPTRDILAEGIISVFKPTVDRLDERVTATRSAQQDLTDHLISLQTRLKEIEEIQKTIPDNTSKVKKIVDIKTKIVVITNILQTSHERLQRLHLLIEGEKYNKVLQTTSSLDSDQ